MTHNTTTMAVGFVIAKAIIMTTTVAAVAGSDPFWHQLLLVIISALLTGIGVIVAAAITAGRLNRHEQQITENQGGINDLKQAMGLDKRAADE